METATQETPREAILRVAKELGIIMIADFVPFSQSRNRTDKVRTLNWWVQLNISDEGGTRGLLATDYTAGSAHCPSYKLNPKTGTYLQNEAIRWECEHGKQARVLPGGAIVPMNSRPIVPDKADVLYSLALDADVLDCGGFEDWASNLGFSTDSRKAETTYRACLDIALKLSSGLGGDGLHRLREACQDY